MFATNESDESEESVEFEESDESYESDEESIETQSGIFGNLFDENNGSIGDNNDSNGVQQSDDETLDSDSNDDEKAVCLASKKETVKREETKIPLGNVALNAAETAAYDGIFRANPDENSESGGIFFL